MRIFVWMLVTLACITVLWGNALLSGPRLVTGVPDSPSASTTVSDTGQPRLMPAPVPTDLVPEPALKQPEQARLTPQQAIPAPPAPAVVSGEPRLVPQVAHRDPVSVNVENVTAKVRQALGTPPANASEADILVHGTTQLGDSAGKFSLMFNAKGCYLQEVEGPITVAAGFDGTASWALASTAEKGYAGGDIALPEGLITVVTGRWAAVNGPCAVRGETAEQGADRITVCLTPNGGGPSYYVDLDSSTWLPQSVYWTLSGERDTWNLTDYRKELGVLLPHRLARVRGTETDTYEITRVSPAPDFTENPYQPAGLRLARIRNQPVESGAANPMRG